MEKIESFKIDHTKLQRGIFLSRVDYTQNYDRILTWDIRMTVPYKQSAMDIAALHTMEHIAATFLRNGRDKEYIIYWGIMGCCTGNYLITHDIQFKKVLEIMKECMEYIRDFEGDIPGATEIECGNCHLNNLSLCKRYAETFLEEVLYNMKKENMIYPENDVTEK